MKRLFDDLFILENMLLTYFSFFYNGFKCVLNDKFNFIMEHFIDIFVNEDALKGTNHIQLMSQIYANHQFDNRENYLRSLNISNSTLQRYREKYCRVLSLVIKRCLPN